MELSESRQRLLQVLYFRYVIGVLDYIELLAKRVSEIHFTFDFTVCQSHSKQPLTD